MRIQKYLRDLGYGSRRGIEKLINENRIGVNGKTAILGQNVSDADKISIDGNTINKREKKRRTYILLNKPEGYVSTKQTQYGEDTVYNLLPDKFRDLNIAGRLDKNSRGLILLSNDGDFVYRLTHPSFEIQKKYRVVGNRSLSRKELSSLSNGVEFEGVVYKAKNIKDLGKQTIEITLTEGKKREIRYMLKSLNIEVLDLQRIKIGDFSLEGIPEGEWKEVNVT